MSEIPEDVKIAAVDAVLAGCGILSEVEVIARAILAERRRCAEIARGLNGWGPVGGNKVAEHIAKVIEEGVA